ncbi:Probable amino acid permease 7 [Striga hermonthica]|uniref:Probable amino acid permease 7 n=1 Tax=Striga hermonthica TaxID=68872 RepID=A0A9N7NE83_STRHE|nr:Probable amino acid permease 7 [Striga hermonthica]
MGAADSNEPIPLLQLGLPSPPVDDDLVDSELPAKAAPNRTGNAWTAVAHIITGVIGSGVLSLAWSMAQLGWVWGPLLMLLFAAVTLASTFLLCSCYRSPDPDYGPVRNGSYLAAVKRNLGKKNAWICALLIQMNLYGTGIAYTITTAICMRAIRRSSCYRKDGEDDRCEFGSTQYMLIFGVVQIFMSQIPDFHSMEWLSVVAAIMSLAYSTIGLGLGAAKVVGSRVIKGSVGGVSASNTMQKLWRVSQAVGDIAFAYPYSMIVLEIQDTLRSPPSERETMNKASLISTCITTFFYLSCGGFGYAAFGDQTPGDLLTGFANYGSHWVIDFANACVVVHLIGGYQVYSQPVFAMVDKWLADRFPCSSFVNRNYTLKFPLLPPLSLNLERLCFRTAYVASTTGVAMVFPYFNQSAAPAMELLAKASAMPPILCQRDLDGAFLVRQQLRWDPSWAPLFSLWSEIALSQLRGW